MRLAELSSRSGLSTATIKYYLRLGLLSPGVTESTTWASYDESHLRRLRLIRALTELGDLSLDDVRRAVTAIDGAATEHALRGAAQWALSRTPERTQTEAAVARVDALLARHGWELHPESPYRASLAAALDAVDALAFPVTDEILDAYAAALAPVADLELARIAGEDPETVAERVVVGTVLYEPVLLTLRRIAHEVASGRAR